jgi:uncharacterized protein (TIGR02598 family)
MSGIFRNRKAFSLVEVAMAMGMITFCLVAVLGLLPVGLSTFRAATETTIESQIVNQIASDATLMPFSKLSDYAGASPYYFNEEGSPVQAEREASYWANLSLQTPNYPDKPANIGDDLVNLQVKITTIRNRNAPNKVHNLFVARSDASTSTP